MEMIKVEKGIGVKSKGNKLLNNGRILLTNSEWDV